MKRITHTLKHRQTSKVLPAYNTHNTPFKRILPPVRDQHTINTFLLCKLLIWLAPDNKVALIPGGISINTNEVKITEGMVSCEQLRFRFKDVWDLLMNLRQERILIVNMNELKEIKKVYYDNA